MRRLIRTGFAVSVLSSFIPIEALAQGANTGVGGDPRNSVAQPEMSGNPSAIATTSIQASLGAASDPNGLRRFLSDHGIVYSFNALADILGDTSGGTRRTATVIGRIGMQLDADLGRLAGWSGAAFRVEAYKNGVGLTRAAVSDLAVVSELEVIPRCASTNCRSSNSFSTVSWLSKSAMSRPIPNSWSARPRRCSSTPLSGGRGLRARACPAAAPPIRSERLRSG